MGGTLYFEANGGSSGYELWKSDGTSSGTVLVRDIREGEDGSYPESLTAVGGTLYFSANDGTNGSELWKSDGTSSGTVLVRDIQPGTAGSDPEYLTNVGGTLYFEATDGTNGDELWTSDGTSSGTVLVAEVVPGSYDGEPSYFTAVGNTLFLTADDGNYGRELWAFAEPTGGTLTATLDGGNLIVTDTADEANALTVFRDGGDLVIADAAEQFVSAPMGWTLAGDGKSIRIAAASFTGNILINANGGNDTLTVDFAGGNPIPAGGVNYAGGSGDDSLAFTGGAVTSLAFNYTNATDGSALLDATTLSYTGLEANGSSLTAASVTLNYNGGTETITVTDGGSSSTTVSSTAGTSTTFANPTTLLTINPGSGADAVTVTSFGSGFTAGLTINDDAGADTVNLNAAVTFAAGRHLTVVADIINVGAGASWLTSGSIGLTADRMDLAGASASVGSASATVALRPLTDGTAIDLGSAVDTTASTLELSDAELDSVAAATLQIGHAMAGAISLTAAITRASATAVGLTSGAGIAFVTGSLDSAGGDVTLTPGGASAVTAPAAGIDVTAGTLAFAAGADLKFAVNGTTVDSQYDQLKAVGGIDLTGVDLVLSGSHVPVSGNQFVLVNNDGSDSITGTFTGLAEGAKVTLNGVGLTISYKGGDGNDVVLAFPAAATAVIDDGTAQRSMVRWVTLTFPTPQTLLALRDVAVIPLKPLTGTLLLSGKLDAAGTSMKVTFTGTAITGGSLPDGRYTLKYDGEEILAGDSFFRFFGDITGDGFVSADEKSAFTLAMNTRRGVSYTGGKAYNEYFDFNADNYINSRDLSQFNQRYLLMLP